jgi:predicted nucleotidyltransferase component of viral defense system
MIGSPNQLKDRLRNKEKQLGIPANTLIHTFMMERLLERISESVYKDQFIIKGGFLIASMIGIDLRSTLDLDTTIHGLNVDEDTIRSVIQEIMTIDLDDHVQFSLDSIQRIREGRPYEDYRLLLRATFFTVKVMIKIDVTTGDAVIPREITYSYPLMFEERAIPIKAYNLQTILAEKIETILARNVTNTRARDFYDVYMLIKTHRESLDRSQLKAALDTKTKERQTSEYLENHSTLLAQIKESPDLLKIWKAYQKQYAYATGIDFNEVVDRISDLLDSMS